MRRLWISFCGPRSQLLSWNGGPSVLICHVSTKYILLHSCVTSFARLLISFWFLCLPFSLLVWISLCCWIISLTSKHLQNSICIFNFHLIRPIFWWGTSVFEFSTSCSYYDSNIVCLPWVFTLLIMRVWQHYLLPGQGNFQFWKSGPVSWEIKQRETSFLNALP